MLTWIISSFMLCIGILIFGFSYKVPPTTFYFILWMFGFAFTISTPLFFWMTFRNTFFNTEEGIQNLYVNLYKKIVSYENAERKILNYIIKEEKHFIGFGNWLNKNYISSYEGKWSSILNEKLSYTTKELFEIYEIEKKS